MSMLPDLDSFRFDDAARASCDIEYLWRDTMVFGASQSAEQQRWNAILPLAALRIGQFGDVFNLRHSDCSSIALRALSACDGSATCGRSESE